MRTGWGYDAHRFGGQGPLKLAGVAIEAATGLEGTSDADVASHAVADALLGAAVLGDLGEHFPNSVDADSMTLLARVVDMVKADGWRVVHIDVTIVSEGVRIAPHRLAMRQRLGAALGLEVGAVSVKATSTDGLGFAGRGEGISAMAVATITRAT